MEKKEKFEPKDSNQQHRKSDQAVKSDGSEDYQRKEPKTKAPARKRQFSEQPPTKHNSKT